ncbi:MAG: toll/interleukin-1 receptor domain-containing protein [Proteobacteria bacterium]|nr:toll/interleukin-1 receptor domain-containing protein [Pseudomonadota bacterium]
MKDLPIILVDAGAIPDRDSGALKEVHVYYRFDQQIEGVSEILPNQEQLIFKIDELSERKRAAFQMLSEILSEKVEPPSKRLFGKEVTATPVFHHFVYQIEDVENKYYLRCGGRFRWPGGAEGDFQPKFRRSDVTTEQQMVLDQILPWAKEQALQHAQVKVNEVFKKIGEIPTVHVSKKLVMISYRSTESAEFARILWQMLGETELFRPRIDSYDLDSGNWMPQLEEWIDNCDGFVPVYTPDYENGPVSKQELSRAKRRIGSLGFSFVPVFLSSTPSEKLISDLNGADFRNTDAATLNQETEAFQKVVALLGNYSRNPFDPEG